MLKIILILIIMSNHPIFSNKQADFYYSKLHRINVLSGVTGSGKSFVSNLKWYQYICRVPSNSLLLISGNTEESLYDNIISPLLYDIDKGIGWLKYSGKAGKRRLLVIPTGTEVVCVGANNEKAQDRIQGKNVKGWYADEIVKQPVSFIRMALSRCRTIEEGKMIDTPAIWTCNPDAPMHEVKVDYMDNPDIDVHNWFFGFHDNPLITDEWIEKQKVLYTGVFLERMIYGRWVTAEGSIYANFDKSIHVINDEQLALLIPRIKEYMLFIDWGYVHPMVIQLVGVTGDDQYIILDEIHESGLLINQALVQRIRNQWNQELVYGYADPSRPDYIRQLYELFDCKIQFVPAQNDVNEGIQEVQKLLIKRANNEYGLYIHEKCYKTIKDIQNYRWKNNKAKDEPVKENDDGADSLRYGVFSRRNVNKGITEEAVAVKNKEMVIGSTARKLRG